jgi:hypothetical protein
MKIAEKQIDKDKIFAILKEIKPDLDLNNKLEVNNAIDSLFFSLIVGTSQSTTEMIGRLEGIKYHALKFVYSVNLKKYEKKVVEERMKEEIEKSKKQAG